MKKTQTRLSDLPQKKIDDKRFSELDAKDLRRTVGGLRPTITSGQSTMNCDDWCDCD